MVTDVLFFGCCGIFAFYSIFILYKSIESIPNKSKIPSIVVQYRIILILAIDALIVIIFESIGIITNNVVLVLTLCIIFAFLFRQNEFVLLFSPYVNVYIKKSLPPMLLIICIYGAWSAFIPSFIITHSSAHLLLISCINILIAFVINDEYKTHLQYSKYIQLNIIDTENTIVIPNVLNNTSFTEIILGTMDHILCGYIRNSNCKHIPNAIKNMILYFLIDPFLNDIPSDFDSNFAVLFTNIQINLIQIILRILCPSSTDRLNDSLQAFIHTTLRLQQQKYRNNIGDYPGNPDPILKINYILLWKLTQFHDIDFDYLYKLSMIKVLLKYCNELEHNSIFMFIGGLLDNNSGYYKIYCSIINEYSQSFYTLSVIKMLQRINNDTDIIHLRKVLAPLIVENTAYRNDIFRLVLCVPISNLKFTPQKCKLLWIEKEIEHIINTNTVSLQRDILMEILDKVMDFTILYGETITIHYHKRILKYRAFDIIYTLIEKCQLNLSHLMDKYNWSSLEGFVNDTLRDESDDKVSIIGWTILEMEMNKMKVCNYNDIYRDMFISYIENNADLFASNLENLEKKSGIENVTKQILIAYKVIDEMNKLRQSSKGDFDKFNHYIN